MPSITFFMMMWASILTTLFCIKGTRAAPQLISPGTTGPYRLTDDFSQGDIFSAFDFFHEQDPTKGFVQYLDKPSAMANNLVAISNERQSVFLGVDSKNQDPMGRASVRLESKKMWSHGLLIADIRHMPNSVCGAWPAFWLLSATEAWPQGGEVDILEGVNEDMINQATLHTSPGCVVDNSSISNPGGGQTFSGQLVTSNCDINAEGQAENAGCSIRAPLSLPSYGTPFNDIGGGIYATEWTSSSISVWFFPRSSPSLEQLFPKNGASSPDPSTWGIPIARFSGSGCDVQQRFKNLKIIINTTFCGEWAGRAWESGGCKAKTGFSTCESYVQSNPWAFTEAYWEIAALKWYQKDGSS